MATQRTVYEQDEYSGTDTHRLVADISDRLLEHLNTEEALRLMLAANLPGISSAQVQATFLPFATELGFTSEARGLFREYENKLRPDYFRPVEGSGILLEVERGKTTTNNMDLLDFWKCHLCQQADYLFLMVPQALKHNDAMTPKKEYASVVKRLKTFFAPGKQPTSGRCTSSATSPLRWPPSRVLTEQLSEPAHAGGVGNAMPGLVASLGSWGVRAGHWLPDRGGVPALWLTTQTDAQCTALETTSRLKGQVAILPTRAEISSEGMKRLSVLVDSEKGQERLLRDAT